MQSGSSIAGAARAWLAAPRQRPAGRGGVALLVSVRHAEEAQVALAGGADVIDIKEPHRGPLGMADENVIDAVCMYLEQSFAAAAEAVCSERPPLLSVACGELAEWVDGSLDRRVDGSHAAGWSQVAFAKLGLSGWAGRPHWIDTWRRVRATLTDAFFPQARWVAVAYADERRAASPPLEEVVAMAATTGCAGVLVDTFDKRSGRLWDALPAGRLCEGIAAARQAGLFVAVAGRLRAEDVPRAVAAGADVVAVRSAACAGGDRMRTVCRQRVKTLADALKRTAGSARVS